MTIERITAYRDSSGAVHTTELAAARAEVKLRLEKILEGKAEVCITAILAQPVAIWRALDELALMLSDAEAVDEATQVGETGQTMEERYRSYRSVDDIMTPGREV
jgi:hypothetical protein